MAMVAHPFTFPKKYIFIVSWPFVMKFHVKHHLERLHKVFGLMIWKKPNDLDLHFFQKMEYSMHIVNLVV